MRGLWLRSRRNSGKIIGRITEDHGGFMARITEESWKDYRQDHGIAKGLRLWSRRNSEKIIGRITKGLWLGSGRNSGKIIDRIMEALWLGSRRNLEKIIGRTKEDHKGFMASITEDFRGSQRIYGCRKGKFLTEEKRDDVKKNMNRTEAWITETTSWTMKTWKWDLKVCWVKMTISGTRLHYAQQSRVTACNTNMLYETSDSDH